MNTKGFTLVELLAVVIILALLALLTSTAVTKMFSDAKNDLSATQINLIKSATDLWIPDNLELLSYGGECSYLTVEDLKKYGILDNKILDPKNNKEISDDIKIKISTSINKNGKLVRNVEVNVNKQDISSCNHAVPLCLLAENGDVLPAGISVGDKYTCKVKAEMDLENKEGYTFYVLGSNTNGTINLILERNICEDGTFATKENTCPVNTMDSGPEDAMDHLNNATEEWKEVLRLNETYDDENGFYKDFLITTKARLPKLSEVSVYDEETGSNAFLYNYMREGGVSNNEVSGIGGYYLLDTAGTWSGNLLAVYYMGDEIFESAFWEAEGAYGVRPVITVPTFNLK
ncbi:MAG: prepilin-type N-terminal cleavage/methylation domain-containing protein [Firmicutes bacterium]|nr:prepilin-type N-terminal cleavage/methylation domain-containing protein [Bacillota bacterium]